MDEALARELTVFAVLGASLLLFVFGKWRYDVVAIAALLVLAVVGIVPAAEAYKGFGHPAVITVAAVLVLSRALYNSGVVDVLASWYSRIPDLLTVRVAALSGMTAFLSAFMNNVGAVSLLLPVVVRVSNRSEHPPSRFLMPLAFASLLGGLTTLIGTPPNVIISKFREDELGVPFQMFDFTLVGLAITVAGVAFIALVGWRLIPSRRAPLTLGETLDVESYMTEVRVPENSRFVGKLLRDIEESANEEVTIAGLLHRGLVYPAPSSFQIIDANDVLIIEADPDDLKTFVDNTGFELEGSRDFQEEIRQTLGSEDVSIVEAIAVPDSPVLGKTARDLHLHAEYGVNLLGVSRQGQRIIRRLSRIDFRVGDVLLIQGQDEVVQTALPRLGLLPLAQRELRIGQQRRLFFPIAVFTGALLLTSVGLLSVQVSFVAAIAILVATRFVTLQDAYQSIDWPIIVLLGAMIPVGEALETTGGAARIASTLAGMGAFLPPWAMLGTLLVTTLLLSAIINNAAAVILMAPISISVAQALGAALDPFLMAVAIGGSSAFLTPIGHQSNTIVMGPGGYHFVDYFIVGFPLVVVIVAVAIPAIMWVWPMGI
ncbi:MAG: SLC13 family permease [Chloroflexi bacterium]|nr:SLC13 family permease [Chloroflexota bacterium]